MLSFLFCSPSSKTLKETIDPPRSPKEEVLATLPRGEQEEGEEEEASISSDLPSELILEVMKFASPSTLAAASRCSFDLLAHNSKLLYRDVELETEGQIRALFSRRVSLFRPILSSRFCPSLLVLRSNTRLILLSSPLLS